MTKRIKNWGDDAGPRMRARFGRWIDRSSVLAAVAVVLVVPVAFIIKKAREERRREVEYGFNLKDD